MDLGDPRESLVSLKDHATWEADNRVEERWQWGAQILDLCGMSPEEYKNSTAVTVKKIEDCGDCGGGGGILDNTGKASISSEGEFLIEYLYPVASDLYMFVTFKDIDGNTYKFESILTKGFDKVTYDISDLTTAAPFAIQSLKISFTDDESKARDTVRDKKYEYSATYSGDFGGKTYLISILCTATDSLTEEDYINIIETKGEGNENVASYDEIYFDEDTSEDAMFYALCSYVPEYMPEDVEKEYFKTHSYDFLILTDEVVVEITEDFTPDTENWQRSSINLGGKRFSRWIRRDFSGSQCPYSIGDGTCEDYVMRYNVKIKG